MPSGSVTADHEIVNGTVTDAPLAGESGVGAAGAAAATPPPPNSAATMAQTSTGTTAKRMPVLLQRGSTACWDLPVRERLGPSVVHTTLVRAARASPRG